MSKEPVICGFCGRECVESEDVTFLRFPDGHKKPAHLTHVGVKEEKEYQESERA